MNEGLTASEARFHEMPLVLFSALMVFGCGAGAAHLVFTAAGVASLRPPPSLPSLITVLLATGLIVSLAHLGRPQGIFDTFRRVGRSRLSNEVILAGFALIGSSLSSVLPPAHSFFAPVWVLTLVACVSVLLSLGGIYRLPGRPGWGGPVALQPFTAGLVFGGVLWAASVAEPWPVSYAGLMAVVLFLDLAITLWRGVVLHLAEAVPDHAGFFRLRNMFLPLRLALVDLLPALLLIGGSWRVAVVSVVIGVFLDRTLFYGLGAKRNTEAEVARVEKILAGG